jgi:integrase
MPRRGKRRRIARGIYEDKTGRSGIYRDAAGRPREVRFPPQTPIGEIRDELDSRQAKTRTIRTATDRGTLAHAVARWERLEQHLASWKERRAELRAWVKKLGDRRMTAIRDDAVRSVMGEWTQDDVSPKTIRNRLWSLQHLYRVLYGPDISTPCDHVNPPARVRHVPTPVSPARIMLVYAKLLAFERSGRLRDAKTRGRFMVRASTGRRPSEIMRAKPTDVDLESRTWRVRDGKGGWSEGLYLNDDMVEAWRVFIAADAWGHFNTGSQSEVLRAAGWPEGSRPYDMRASTGIALSESGVDLADVGAWLGHTNLQTTRSAYAPILNSRMSKASALLEGRFAKWKIEE